MSGNVYAQDAGVAGDPFASGEGNVFQRVVLMQSESRKAAQARASAKSAGEPQAAPANGPTDVSPHGPGNAPTDEPLSGPVAGALAGSGGGSTDNSTSGSVAPATTAATDESAAAPTASAADLGQDRPAAAVEPTLRATGLSPKHEANMNLFKTVRPNIVQSIRAFRVVDLADEAARLGQHFLYASCGHAQTKGEVLEIIANSFLFPRHFGKNFDALFDCLTDLVAKAGPQPGFVVVLEALPVVTKFDKEARETLLDVFREAAEFWAERKVTFRVFYSFA